MAAAASCRHDLQQQQRQKCPICLEDLFGSHNHKNSNHKKVGACVPCGHCLHVECFEQWQAASEYHQKKQQQQERQTSTKCPMCNMPVPTFVNLFLDNHVHDKASSRNNGEKGNTQERKKEEDYLQQRFSSLAMDENSNNDEDDDDDADFHDSVSTATSTSSVTQHQELLLLANQQQQQEEGRIKYKLRRYKRLNKSLRLELETERVETEELLASTIHHFYKIMDQHDQERKRLTSTAKTWQTKYEASQKQHAQERRDWNSQRKYMQAEVQKAQHSCLQADQQVQMATKGLADLKLKNTKRQCKVNVLKQERTTLLKENRKLKQQQQVLHHKYSPHSSEHSFW